MGYYTHCCASQNKLLDINLYFFLFTLCFIFTDQKRPRLQIRDDEDTQELFERQSGNAELASRVLKNISKAQCEECTKFGVDKRNEYFANLVLEEMNYVAPCMRSRAFVRILNFLNALKNHHSNDVEMTDTEKL